MLVSGKQQDDSVTYLFVCVYMYIYIYIYILFRFFSILSYYKILGIVPHAIQWVLIVYLFYVQ